MLVVKLPSSSVTRYSSVKSKGHRARRAGSVDAADRPKSSCTPFDEAAAAADEDAADDVAATLDSDSDVDLPRNSHRDVRARPCCGSWLVGTSAGDLPNTGNTMGMPPRTALEPSSTALSLSHSRSATAPPPTAAFHDSTVAPVSRMSTDSPEGRTAVTRSPTRSTRAWGGRAGVAARALGLLRRSMVDWGGRRSRVVVERDEAMSGVISITEKYRVQEVTKGRWGMDEECRDK